MHDQHYLDNLRHSCAHLLAAAVMKLWPNTKRAIGPAIENGFYFDFEFETPISEADFPKIEETMRELVKEWKGFERYELTPSKAKQEYPHNRYKHELIDEFSQKGQTLTFYKSGEYWDLCKGGHVEHPNKELKHFKLLKVAGAYWRGDENNPMLTRIYATVFPTKEELENFLQNLEEAKKRDHRKLGRELNLFVFSELVGPGLPLFTPRGAFIRRQLQQFVNEKQKRIGYEEAWTPQLTKAELFKVSGHYEKYKDDMFKVSSNYSEEEFFLKPMNCPMHAQIYASRPRSYRDLPVRLCDFANLYRDEKPGELSGLTRLRAFSQDDGHCFCREDQIEQEFKNVAAIIIEAIEAFGMQYWIRLSLWDPNKKEKYLGSPDVWERSQHVLGSIVKGLGVEYKAAEGEAAIYGPKLDFMAVDALGREWQISTIQLDFIQPERFQLEYTDADGSRKRPVMIHRAILGSPERFMGLLIEHFAGAFPTWIAPTQAVVIPISQDHDDYAKEVVGELLANGIRAENWNESESMQNRIRKAEREKIPYMLIVGGKEKEAHTVSVRARGNQNRGVVPLSESVQMIVENNKKKSLSV